MKGSRMPGQADFRRKPPMTPERQAALVLDDLGRFMRNAPANAPRKLADIPEQFRKPIGPPVPICPDCLARCGGKCGWKCGGGR